MPPTPTFGPNLCIVCYSCLIFSGIFSLETLARLPTIADIRISGMQLRVGPQASIILGID